MFNDLPFTMAKCLILTIVIELVFAILLGVRNKKDFFTVILVQIVTNPIVVTVPYLIYLNYGYVPYIVSIYVLEIITILVEGLIYFKVLKFRKIDPFVFAFILNGLSYAIGEIINRLL